MNAKDLAQLTIITLVLVLSQLAEQAQAPQLKQTHTLDNLPEPSYPPEKGAPERTVGAGSPFMMSETAILRILKLPPNGKSY